MTTSYRSQVFRTPSPFERRLGLWVDRIGEKVDEGIPPRPRLLGLYGVVYVRTGSGVYVSDSGETAVSAGECMLLHPDAPHRYGTQQSAWSTCWVVFGGDKAKALEQAGLFDARQPTMVDRRRAVERTHAALAPLMSAGDPAACLQRQVLLEQMLLELHEQQARLPAGQADRRIDEVVGLLNQHALEPVRPAALAARAGMSYTSLRRRFRQAMGQSIKEYHIHRRLDRAKQLLAEGGLSVKQVSREVGYDDEYYFMRLFKRHVGVSPGRYR